jgi:hypothetical protein
MELQLSSTNKKCEQSDFEKSTFREKEFFNGNKFLCRVNLSVTDNKRIWTAKTVVGSPNSVLAFHFLMEVFGYLKVS